MEPYKIISVVLITSFAAFRINGQHMGQRCGNTIITRDPYYYTIYKPFCCNEKIVHGKGPVNDKYNGTDACCNGCPYNSYRYACCEGMLHLRDVTRVQYCCGKKMYDSNREICCCGKLRPMECGLGCCGNEFYDQFRQMCCSGVLHDRDRRNTFCCGIHLYDLAKQLCCGGVVHSLVALSNCCPDHDYHYQYHPHHYSHYHVKKRDAKRYKKRHLTPHCTIPCYQIRRYLLCCGSNVYDYRTHRCCKGFIHTNRNLMCCNGALFDPAHQLCCNGKTYYKILGPLTRCCIPTGCSTNHYRHDNSHMPPKFYNPGTTRCCSGHLHHVSGTTLGCCGYQIYDYTRQACCSGILYNIQKFHICCGIYYFDRRYAKCCCNKVMVHKNPESTTCCNGKLHNDIGTCCENHWYVGKFHGCCGDKPIPFGHGCCGNVHPQVYHHGYQVCCRHEVVSFRLVINQKTHLKASNVSLVSSTNKTTKAESLSQSNTTATSNTTASNSTIVKRNINFVSKSYHIACCFMEPYNLHTHFCCCGRIISRKDYSGCCGRTPYNSSKHICCSNSLYSRPFYNACCYLRVPYNYFLHRCCAYGRLAPRGSSCS